MSEWRPVLPRRPDRRRFGPGPHVLGVRPAPGHGMTSWALELPAVRAMDALRLDAPVTFLTGENGSGKSTVLEAVAAAARFPAHGGTLSGELGWHGEDDAGLAPALEVALGPHRPRDGFFLRAESFLEVAAKIDELELAEVYGGVDLHAQSHGESFLALAANRFGADGLYVLDEPEAALSVPSALAFLAVMDCAARGGAQFVVATHPPVLLALPGARVHEVGADGIEPIAWDEAQPVALTRAFLEAPERFLHELRR